MKTCLQYLLDNCHLWKHFIFKQFFQNKWTIYILLKSLVFCVNSNNLFFSCCAQNLLFWKALCSVCVDSAKIFWRWKNWVYYPIKECRKKSTTLVLIKIQLWARYSRVKITIKITSLMNSNSVNLIDMPQGLEHVAFLK